MILVMEDIHAYYGNICALNGINLLIKERQIVTLIGPNGAGKSTTLKTIVGWTRANKGKLMLNGEDITRMPTHQIVARGVTMVPEGREVFTDMTVINNLEMGAFLRKDKRGIQRDLQRVYELFPLLLARRKQNAKSLSGGEQQMLAISRALMSNPSLMLLDEPSLGLAPLLVKTIFQTLREINRQKVTLFLVEQNALMALKLAEEGFVLEKGRLVLHDTCERLLNNDSVRSTYLGTD